MIKFNSGSVETIAQVAARTPLSLEQVSNFNGRMDMVPLRDYTLVTPIHSHSAGVGEMYFTAIGVSRMIGVFDVVEGADVAE